MKAPRELRSPEEEGPLAPEGDLTNLSRKYLEIKICEFSS